jgi:hypothetical protein
MRTSWRIFRLFGIEIRVDSSWIFIFALITWILLPEPLSWLVPLAALASRTGS